MNNAICDSNHDIMEYLIKKLESRQRNLNGYTNLFNSIDSIEAFYLKRKDIFNLFQNLKEELRQASLAIKALMIQNKALSEEKIQFLDNKKNFAKILKENNYLLKENNNLTQKLKELNKENTKIFEKKIKSPYFNNPYNLSSSNNIKNYKRIKDFQKNKLKTNKSFENKKYQINTNSYRNKTCNTAKNFNKKKLNQKMALNNNKIKNDYLNESYDDINQLKNAKAIMEDMKKNKLKLKEVVNEHFGKNAFQ